MEYVSVTTLNEFHQRYRQQKQTIEKRLRSEIELFRNELDKFSPHSRCEIERWNFGIYQELVQRRSRMLQLLFE